MTARPQTTFAPAGKPGAPEAHNPFKAAAKLRKPARKPTSSFAPVDVSSLTICRDPVPRPTMKPGKYEETFAQMEPGDNLRCTPKQVSTIAKALKKWLADNKYAGTVLASARCEDGIGRVWWMASTPPKQRA